MVEWNSMSGLSLPIFGQNLFCQDATFLGPPTNYQLQPAPYHLPHVICHLTRTESTNLKHTRQYLVLQLLSSIGFTKGYLWWSCSSLEVTPLLFSHASRQWEWRIVLTCPAGWQISKLQDRTIVFLDVVTQQFYFPSKLIKQLWKPYFEFEYFPKTLLLAWFKVKIVSLSLFANF